MRQLLLEAGVEPAHMAFRKGTTAGVAFFRGDPGYRYVYGAVEEP